MSKVHKRKDMLYTIIMHNSARSQDKGFMPALHESRTKPRAKTLLVGKKLMGKKLKQTRFIVLYQPLTQFACGLVVTIQYHY